MTEEFFQRLQTTERTAWQSIHASASWQRLKRGIDEDFYVTLMTQVYHYTRFNAQNQALVAVSLTSERLPLLKYCLHHAYTEAGHDLMVLKDLETIGVSAESVRASRPLPETEAFIGYLFRLKDRDATARLGYSYWAEGCYPYLEDFLVTLRRDLKLQPSQLSFLVAHSVIDKAHLEEVKEILRESCANDRALQDGVVDVLETSLHLMKNIYDAVHARHPLVIPT
ncbi:MAG: iron-containing redox enzyme family protein [Polyangiaceae bacterium]